MSALLVQTFKAPQQWRGDPPGIGDFVRGACHLFERLEGTGIELRIDVSQTGFAHVIEQDPSLFYAGDPQSIADAGEHFEDDARLEVDLRELRRSGSGVLHVCSNMGTWNRVQLADRTRAFIRRFYDFVPEVEAAITSATGGKDYCVVSIRCGDQYFADPEARVDAEAERIICRLLEREVLSAATAPLLVMSDCAPLKRIIAERFNLLTLPHHSQHGAFGHADVVASDLCLLKRSACNYHINAWSDWWSGFSHYTSIIFKVPSVNFRSPRFDREEITADGQMRRSWWPRRGA